MTAAVKDAVLALLPGRPRLLALGEPAHGREALHRLRNELFRELVEREGYRTITIESDCLRGIVVDDYVTAGSGDFDEVMTTGFSHDWGAFPGNRELVRWMRQYNEGRPAAEQVRFAGFDGPLEISHAASPREALTGLYAYLREGVDVDLLPCRAETLDRLLGPDDRWTDPGAMRDPSRSIGQTPDAQRLRLLADDLVALLDSQAPSLRGDRARARLHARTATGLLRYHRWMADTSPSRIAQLLGVRDAMMAANLLALAERGPLLVNAHNSHLQRDRSSMTMGGRVEWWSAGAIVDDRLGAEYAFVASALGTIRDQGVGTPEPATIEGRLYASPDRYQVADPRRSTAEQARVSTWFGYAPLDPAHLPRYDAIVFVKDA